jgi:hypothetical protein
MPISMKFEKRYPTGASSHWRGNKLLDVVEFDLFLQGPVKNRVSDADFSQNIADDLQALATTQMASQTLLSVLSASPPPLDWEIGEAIAECLLMEEFDVSWPWNENRDRKTPKASLPGADLVGLVGNDANVTFLFGEVKTSSDKNQPPGVMAGRSGLAHQIDNLASSPTIPASLVRWLYARCKNTAYWPRFESACTRYLQSGGKDVVLVGVLLRDTTPNENDLRSRGEALAALTQPPTARLDAWYTPRLIAEWVSTVTSGPK